MRVHVAGAGIAGMAAAVEAAARGAEVIVHEAAGHAGGRARSFHDETLGREIDNGSHLMLSGNHAARRLAAMLGAADELEMADTARFDFLELEDGLRWDLDMGRGRFPGWLFDAARRVPETEAWHYLAALKLLVAGERTVSELFDDGSAMWRRFWEPFSLGVLNTPPDEALARLLLPVLRETLGRGGEASRPMLARRGLSHAFARPFEKSSSWELRLNHPLRGLEMEAGRVRALRFDDGEVALGADERLIVALPPWALRELLPPVMAPSRFNPIVNVHFRLSGGRMPDDAPRLCGLLGGVGQWLFTRGDVASVTISAAWREAAMDRRELARTVWPEAARALMVEEEPLPPFRVIKEKRATFAQTPAQCRRRAPADCGLGNLWLAGDWTDTGLPATIEGAARSGFRAAELALG